MNPSPPSDQAMRLLHQALTSHQQGRLEVAMAQYQQVLAVDPTNFDALYGLGMLYGQQRRLEEALHCFTATCAARPGDFSIHYNRGVALQELGRYGEAEDSYRRAIALRPDFADAHDNLGVVLKEQGRFDEALAQLDKALSLAPAAPMAHNNRGAVLETLGRYDEALADCDMAIALNPNLAKAHNNRGVLLTRLHRYDEAMAGYDRAIALRPDYAEAYYNKALLALLLGDYAQGWPLYEWRWQTALKDYVRDFHQPLWLKDRSLAGRSLLLYGDQGFGDVIQMLRYLPRVTAQCGKLILEVPGALVPLLATQRKNYTLVAKGSPLLGFDLHCSLMSLPLAFKTTLETIPAPLSYLTADERRRAAWRQRLGPKTKPRIGLAWSGNPEHKNDHNRSLPLRTLLPLLERDCEFHSLQKEVRAADRDTLASLPQLKAHQDELNDFADTAALIAELDLVISVDTAVAHLAGAHLAGALGKPVWILLPYDPDFRWLTERSDSPWYPSARLFRQPRLGDWPGVVTAVGEALAALHRE